MFRGLTVGNQPKAFEYNKVQHTQDFPKGEAQNPILNIYMNKPENSVEQHINIPVLKNQEARDNPGEPVMDEVENTFEQDLNKLKKPRTELKARFYPIKFEPVMFQDPNKVLYKK